MAFTLSEEQFAIQDTARRFASERLAPNARVTAIYEGSSEVQRIIIARAAAQNGLTATIVVPRGNATEKNDARRARKQPASPPPRARFCCRPFTRHWSPGWPATHWSYSAQRATSTSCTCRLAAALASAA